MKARFGSLFTSVSNGLPIRQEEGRAGVPISRIETISSGVVDGQRVGYADALPSTHEEQLLVDGDILFSHINSPQRVGNCALYRGDPPLLLHGMNLLRLRCDCDMAIPGFVLYLIRSPKFRASLKPFVNRAVNQASISIRNLTSIPVDLPSLDEQRRIAQVLDAADGLRTKRRHYISKCDALLQSIFRVLLEVEEYRRVTLGDVADLFAGTTLPEGKPFQGEADGYFLMKVSDMNAPGNEVSVEACSRWRKHPGQPSATCPPGAVVFPKRGGAIATNKKRRTTRPTILDPNLMGVAPKDGVVTPNFLLWWFREFDLSSVVSGSSVPQLNKQDLVPLRLPIPDTAAQARFEEQVAVVSLARQTAERHLGHLDALFASLQHHAFAGEV